MAELIVARREDLRRALVSEESTWSWADVVAEAAARAAMLGQLRQDGPFHIGVLLENVPEYVFLLLAAALSGATVVGINPTRRGAELERDIRHTDCQLVLTDAGLAPLLDGLELGAARGRILDIGLPDYARLIGGQRPAPATEQRPGPEEGVAPDTLYLLLFTSGSTGAPKAVRMTQGRAARGAAESARAFTPDDVLYCAMPLFHGNALMANLLPALVSGATVVLRRRFSASAFTPDVRRHGCTFFNYVGRALSYILAVPESPQDGDNRLRWALGSEASPQNIAEFTRRFGCPIHEGYGSSENAVIIVPVPGTPPTALGRPKRGSDVIIVDPETGTERAPARLDPDGRLLNPADAVGEIVGRGSADRFEGYYNNPEADEQRTRGGWYWSGDLGYRDPEGFIYFAGRTADWLRVDGENFSAGAVERILNRFPGLTGVAVYGVPDVVGGDQVMAAVEMGPGVAFDPEALADFLSAQGDLGTKWSPRYVRVVGALPVTGTAKVDKAPLRAERWETTDPVWWQSAPGDAYRRMTTGDVAMLRQSFEAHGRGLILAR